jgi:dTDP-4-dehydrorhamnose 3,5-epimerase
MKSKQLLTRDGRIIEGPLLLTPTVFDDERGYFYESWNLRTFNYELRHYGEQPQNFVQENQSSSKRNTLRGLHWQKNPHAQGKLVRCVSGSIFDVIVDLRTDSLTYKEWCGVYLQGPKFNQLWVPPGFAHGFLTLSMYADVIYKTTRYWNKGTERSLRWNDPDINIAWPTQDAEGNDSRPVLSDKDSKAPLFSQLNQTDLF